MEYDTIPQTRSYCTTPLYAVVRLLSCNSRVHLAFIFVYLVLCRWHDDKAHGWGMKAFANGDRHEGEYCLDLRQGCGTYHWANGDCYEGDWEVRGRVVFAAFSF